MLSIALTQHIVLETFTIYLFRGFLFSKLMTSLNFYIVPASRKTNLVEMVSRQWKWRVSTVWMWQSYPVKFHPFLRINYKKWPKVRRDNQRRAWFAYSNRIHSSLISQRQTLQNAVRCEGKHSLQVYIGFICYKSSADM